MMKEKNYQGKRDPRKSECVVTVNGKILKNDRYHSPTGFEWGYNGSGPCQLAREILKDFLGKENRKLWVRLEQCFKSAFIAPIEESSWEITGEQIYQWLIEIVKNDEFKLDITLKDDLLDWFENDENHEGNGIILIEMDKTKPGDLYEIMRSLLGE